MNFYEVSWLLNKKDKVLGFHRFGLTGFCLNLPEILIWNLILNHSLHSPSFRRSSFLWRWRCLFPNQITNASILDLFFSRSSFLWWWWRVHFCPRQTDISPPSMPTLKSASSTRWVWGYILCFSVSDWDREHSCWRVYLRDVPGLMS